MKDARPHIPADGATLRPRGFWRLVGRLEHETLEFKRSAHHLRDAIPAMAMSEGGVIVLGVSDDRRLVGRSLDQETLDRVTAAACECGVEVGVREVRVGRVPLTLVLVPAVRDRIVTTPDGRLLRRIGSSNQPLRGEAVTRFVRAREAALAAYATTR
jgi:predicted HTH transcriptional regulator